MSRSQVRFTLAVVTVLLLFAVGYHVRVSLRAQRHTARILSKLAADVSPEADQRMQNFHRVKVRDGKKLWEVAARQARYSEESGEIVIERPALSLYLSDGEIIALRCREGRIHVDLQEQDVTRMELKGDIEMQIGDFSLKAQEAVYESERNIVSSSGPVQITGRGLTVEAQGYTVEVADKRVTLNAEVYTTVTRGDG